MRLPIQHWDSKTIAVQTFLVIWRLKDLNRRVSTIVIFVEAVFLILIIAIPPPIHTHPPTEYYITPAPVLHLAVSFLADNLCDSIGAGWAHGFWIRKLPWSIAGSGRRSSVPFSYTFLSSCYISRLSRSTRLVKGGTCRRPTSDLCGVKPEIQMAMEMSPSQPFRDTALRLSLAVTCDCGAPYCGSCSSPAFNDSIS